MSSDPDFQESYYESVIKLSNKVDKITSDGKATEYYDFPVGASTLNDIIEFKDMSFARGNIFKAAYRLGEKEGIDDIYDLNKIIYYAKRLIKLNKKRSKLTK